VPHGTTTSIEQTIRILYLEEFIPTRRNNDGVLGIGRESDTRNPLGVSTFDVVFTFT
jgi:hypothetical protein